MKKSFFIINLVLVILFSSIYICMANDDILVWAEVSSNSIAENEIFDTSVDPNVSDEMLAAALEKSKKVNNNVTNSIETNVSDSLLTAALNQSKQSNNKLIETSNTIQNNPLNLSCGGAILIEQNSGEVLYDYNMHEKLRPASVTKIMTVLLIMEALDSGKISLTDKIPCSENASNMGGSQIWLDTTEQLTVDEMLKAICVVSANDCTVAMAEYLEGSEEAFVAKMNEKAKALGMSDTTFKNCHGIDEDGHVTSPYDIALMSKELLTKYPNITNYTTIYMDSLRDGKSQLVNTNKLVRNYEGCTGLKTGSTSVALFNLSASATRNNLSLIAVIMKAETTQVRFEEARKLLDYGFSNYQYQSLAVKNKSVGTASIGKGLKNKTEAVFSDNFGLILQKSNSQNIEQSIEIYDNISAPINIRNKIR